VGIVCTFPEWLIGRICHQVAGSQPCLPHHRFASGQPWAKPGHNEGAWTDHRPPTTDHCHPNQGKEGAGVRQRRDAPGERQRDHAEALGAHLGEQRALGAHAHHVMAARADAAHQRQQELAEGEVDVGELDDFHSVVSIVPLIVN
jgi:hypothetical protein